MKFLRNYEIRIKTPATDQRSGELITITPPISAIIDVDRHVMSTTNNASITIYNLSPGTRLRLYKDKYIFSQYWQISIYAGYGSNQLYEIFRGNIRESYSYKDGTEWITKIDAYDGSYGIQNGVINTTIAAGTDKKAIVNRLIGAMPNILVGKLGAQTEGSFSRGTVLFGPAYDELNKMVNGQAFIDNETAYVLDDGEVIKGNVFVLSKDNLFSTPKRRDTFLECESLFAPEIRVANVCEINSKESRYDGQYKVLGIKHSLTVSSSEVGRAVSVISLYAGTQAFTEVS